MEDRFALLIDADNVSAKYIKPILDELSKYGNVTYKRIYGDWTKSNSASWKEELLQNSITPIQQFSYTQGKNSTDSAMIIDAMDMLYTSELEGFCLVSSDSDFTKLASRLRESGKTVIGMGEGKTPSPFRKACDIFTELELLLEDNTMGKEERNTHSHASGKWQKKDNHDSMVSKEKIEEAVELASEMVAIGKNMNKRTVALITDMSRPLGMAVGNGLEMREAIQVLRGEVPVDDQLVRVCFSLAGNMLKLSGLTDSVETAVPKLQAAIKSGAALNKLREMIERLGGDTSYIDEPDKLVNTRRIVPVLAPRSGYIGAMNAKQIGLASLLIGAGREHVSDTVDPAVGILMHKRYGDKVSCGEAFASMYVNDERNLAQALDMLVSAVEISPFQPPEMKLIYKTIE